MVVKSHHGDMPGSECCPHLPCVSQFFLLVLLRCVVLAAPPLSSSSPRAEVFRGASGSFTGFIWFRTLLFRPWSVGAAWSSPVEPTAACRFENGKDFVKFLKF